MPKRREGATASSRRDCMQAGMLGRTLAGRAKGELANQLRRAKEELANQLRGPADPGQPRPGP
eukprot:480651-Pyramimonas_sp.AAC.1